MVGRLLTPPQRRSRRGAPARPGSIVSVDKVTPAQRVGLQKGDILITVNGTKVQRTRDLEQLLKTRQPTWRLQVNRGGKILIASVGA